MEEKYKHLIEHLPFLIGAVGNIRPNYTRIVEAFIIAAFTAMATSYMTVEKLTWKYEVLSEKVDTVELTINHLHPRGYPQNFVPKIPED